MNLAAQAVFGFKPEPTVKVPRTKRPISRADPDAPLKKLCIPKSRSYYNEIKDDLEDGVEETKDDQVVDLEYTDDEPDTDSELSVISSSEALETTETRETTEARETSKPTACTFSVESVNKPSTNRSELWVDKYRPIQVVDVVGNSKAKKELQRWMGQYSKKPCLLVGPVGIGKTSLASCIFRDHGFTVVRPRDFIGQWMTKLQNVLVQHSFVKQSTAILIDDAHTLDRSEKLKLTNCLKRKVFRVPIICIVDADTPPKQYAALKSLSCVVTMYKPWQQNQDARIVLKRLQDRTGFSFPMQLADQCRGDLRALTIAAQMVSSHTSTTGNVDLFVSPFEAAKRLLSPLFPDKDADKLASDSMIPLFTQHNVMRSGSTLEQTTELLAACSDHDVLQWKHSECASTIVVEALKTYHKPTSRGFKIQYPPVLGKMSTQKANRFKLKSLKKMQDLTAQSSQVIATDLVPFLKQQLPVKKGKSFRVALNTYGLSKEDGDFIQKLRTSSIAK